MLMGVGFEVSKSMLSHLCLCLSDSFSVIPVSDFIVLHADKDIVFSDYCSAMPAAMLPYIMIMK